VFRTKRGRLTLRERLESAQRGNNFYAVMTGKPKVESKLLAALPPKRDRVKRPVDGRPVLPYEKEILADALKALRDDPRVAFADRRQSGVFQDGERYIRVGTRGVLDISGMLRGGRYFELEAKRPGEKPGDDQRRRIESVQAGGGISGFFTSAAEALALLP
jgi:hypothetical protein